MWVSADWWLFGGGKEWEENEEETAIREIQEELNLLIQTNDLERIGFTVVEIKDTSRYDVTIFASPWKVWYEKDMKIWEWAWYRWMTTEDMRQLENTYSVDMCHMDIVEHFFTTLHA
jgi:8-oxo-dGTP pyrophosphatase MutT (NUDIX family)